MRMKTRIVWMVALVMVLTLPGGRPVSAGPKDSKVNPALTALYAEHAAHAALGATAPSSPAIPR